MGSDVFAFKSKSERRFSGFEPALISGNQPPDIFMMAENDDYCNHESYYRDYSASPRKKDRQWHGGGGGDRPE